MEKPIKYFEFTSPYCAMVAADSEEEAIKTYVEVVSDFDIDLDGGIDELDRDYALVQFARSRSENGELLPFNKLMDEFEEKGVLLMDSALS